jgi:glycosyltransferase involved in cell wall biosynthesis
MKILEAWARGVPVIATPEAAAGLESLDGVRLASGGDEFAAAVDELADRPEAIRRLVEAGRRDLALFHDPPAVAGRLIAAAAEAAARPQGSPSARTEERRSSA